MSDLKKLLRKVWHFLWYEDSIWSWIVNILLAFILIKFVVYPGLGFMLGTSLPVVAVVSESMDHSMMTRCTQCNYIEESCQKKQYEICGKYYDKKSSLDFAAYWEVCGPWYTARNITREEFESYPMHNGFKKGDIIVLRGVDEETLKPGTIIVYQSKLPYPIIHRVVATGDVVQTKGDHNSQQLQSAYVDERYITHDQIIGQAWFKIPYLGYVKIWFVDALSCITFNGCGTQYCKRTIYSTVQ